MKSARFNTTRKSLRLIEEDYNMTTHSWCSIEGKPCGKLDGSEINISNIPIAYNMNIYTPQHSVV